MDVSTRTFLLPNKCLFHFIQLPETNTCLKDSGQNLLFCLITGVISFCPIVTLPSLPSTDSHGTFLLELSALTGNHETMTGNHETMTGKQDTLTQNFAIMTGNLANLY